MLPFICMSISDETYNSYLAEGLNTVDETARWAAYQQADQWLYENFNALPICETLSAIVYNSRIATFNQSAVGRGCLGVPDPGLNRTAPAVFPDVKASCSGHARATGK